MYCSDWCLILLGIFCALSMGILSQIQDKPPQNIIFVLIFVRKMVKMLNTIFLNNILDNFFWNALWNYGDKNIK